MNALEKSHNYEHADEMAYSKLYHIFQKNPEHCKSVVKLMGVFYQLRTKQRLIYKLFNCIGIKEGCFDVRIIAPGSAAQAIEGHHYYKYIRLHQKRFDTLVQFQFEKIKS